MDAATSLPAETLAVGVRELETRVDGSRMTSSIACIFLAFIELFNSTYAQTNNMNVL